MCGCIFNHTCICMCVYIIVFACQTYFNPLAIQPGKLICIFIHSHMCMHMYVFIYIYICKYVYIICIYFRMCQIASIFRMCRFHACVDADISYPLSFNQKNSHTFSLSHIYVYFIYVCIYV